MTADTSPAAIPAGGAVAPPVVEASKASAAKAVLRQAGRAFATLVLSLVVLGLLWVAALKIFDIPQTFGKSPMDVWRYLFDADAPRTVRPKSLSAEEARADSFGALATTIVDSTIGFVCGVSAAILIAGSFILLRPIEFAFMPIALLLRSVPLVAIAPVLLLITGKGKIGVAVIASIVVLFPVLVNTVLGLRTASASSLDLIRVNGGTKWSALTRVRFPAALPYLFASIRISVPGAVVGAMLGEWLTGFNGLGGVLSDYRGRANYGGVWTVVALAVITSIVGYLVASVAETAVLAKWGPDAGKS